MQIQYDRDLLEDAVFACCRTPSAGFPKASMARFHAAREALYRISDPEEQADAFFRLNLTWFREWGLEARVVGLVDDFPLIREHLRVLAFRKARNKGEEAAELFVNPETGRHGVVAILPGRLAEIGRAHV